MEGKIPRRKGILNARRARKKARRKSFCSPESAGSTLLTASMEQVMNPKTKGNYSSEKKCGDSKRNSKTVRTSCSWKRSEGKTWSIN